MQVVSIRKIDKKKSEIELDDGEKFYLYNGEVKRLSLCEDYELSQKIYSEIMLILKKRCKERALYIIERRDKTKFELRKKLIESGYPDSIIDLTIEFLEKYDYLNDLRYGISYVKSNMHSKSIRQMEYQLRAKGLDRDTINNIFNDINIESREVIRKVLVSRRFDFENASYEEKNKQLKYLLSKGFNYDDIIDVVRKGS